MNWWAWADQYPLMIVRLDSKLDKNYHENNTKPLKVEIAIVMDCSLYGTSAISFGEHWVEIYRW